METKLIRINSLVTENLQIRVEMQEESIEHYAAIFRETPDKLPPVTVFYDVTLDKYYLADGFHRVVAKKRNGSDTILAEVHEGTFDDALRYALKANAENAINRSKDDMIHAMEIVWDKWDTLYGNEKRTTDDGTPSRLQLMSLCCVTDYMAKIFLQKKRAGESPDPQISKVTKKPLHCTTETGKNASAIVTTNAHLEERNPSIRKLLKDGKDRFGVVIPERLKPVLESREPQAYLRDLDVIRKGLEEKRISGDLAFAVFVPYAITHINNLITSIRKGLPYCVCRACRGVGCGSCSRLGFQTERQYDITPAEFKDADDL